MSQSFSFHSVWSDFIHSVFILLRNNKLTKKISELRLKWSCVSHQVSVSPWIFPSYSMESMALLFRNVLCFTFDLSNWTHQYLQVQAVLNGQEACWSFVIFFCMWKNFTMKRTICQLLLFERWSYAFLGQEKCTHSVLLGQYSTFFYSSTTYIILKFIGCNYYHHTL